MAYPSKPWSDGQIATGIVPGETFVYDASQSVWVHQTKATLDSDYQVDKTAIEADITSNTSAIAAANARIDADSDRLTVVSTKVDAIESMSDSETARIQANIASISTAFAMLDSDGSIIQGLRTDLEAEISTTNSEISTIQARLDSDETVIQSLQTQIDNLDSSNTVLEADHDSDISNLAIPIISATQPAGKAGQLWVNLNDGRLYYWDTSQETFTEIVAGA